MTMDADAERATTVVKATCALHNMLRTLDDEVYLPQGYADQRLPGGAIVNGFWRGEQQLDGLAGRHRNHAVAAGNVRNAFAEWFSEQGQLDWRDQHINRVR